jgi:hypothetical protein
MGLFKKLCRGFRSNSSLPHIADIGDGGQNECVAEAVINYVGPALIALIFAGIGVHGLMTGLVPETRSISGPMLHRRDHPFRYWSYIVAMFGAAAVITYAMVFIGPGVFHWW